MTTTVDDKHATMGAQSAQVAEDGMLRRYFHFLNHADPRCLLPELFFNISLDQSIEICKHPTDNMGAATRKLAKKIRDSAIHHDTGLIVPAPFRMSGFAVFGSPLIAGMLVSATGSPPMFITRLVSPIPLLVVPSVIMMGLEKISKTVRNVPKVWIPVQVALASLSFIFGLPVSLNVFPH